MVILKFILNFESKPSGNISDVYNHKFQAIHTTVDPYTT